MTEKATRKRMTAVDKTETQRLAARADEARARLEARAVRAEDDLTFWQRRVITLGGVANTAGVLALGTAFIQADDMAAMARLIVLPFHYFAIGACMAGGAVLLQSFAAAVSFVSALNETLATPRGRIVHLCGLILSALVPVTAAGSCVIFAGGVAEAAGIIKGFIAAS